MRCLLFAAQAPRGGAAHVSCGWCARAEAIRLGVDKKPVVSCTVHREQKKAVAACRTNTNGGKNNWLRENHSEACDIRQLQHSTEWKENRGAVTRKAARPTAPSLHTSGTAQHGCCGTHTPPPCARCAGRPAPSTHTHKAIKKTSAPHSRPAGTATGSPRHKPALGRRPHPPITDSPQGEPNFPRYPRTGHPVSLLTACQWSLMTAPAAYPTTSP